MKKFFLFLSSIVFWVGNGFSQILQFEEVPDSLNPFVDLDINNIQDGYWYGQVQFADIDSDGELEVVLYDESYDYGHYVFQKDQFGEFQSINLIDTEIGSTIAFLLEDVYMYSNNAELHFLDLDADGDNDIAVEYNDYQYINDQYLCFATNPGRLRFFENNNNEEYQYLSEIDLNDFSPGIVDHVKVSFVDLDNDGDKDYIAHYVNCVPDVDKYESSQASYHRVYDRIDDTLHFESAGILADFTGFQTEFSYADLDNDGDQDALYAIYNDSLLQQELWWKERLTPNSFANDTLASVVWIDQPYLRFKLFDFEDFDDDGLLEYIEYDIDLEKVRLFKEVEMVNSIENIEELLESQISIYPNPAMDIVSINTDLEIKGLEIFNSLRQKLRSINFEKRQIDVSTFSKGLYFFEFRLEEGTVRKRVVKN